MAGIYRKGGQFYGHIDTDRGPLPVRLNTTNRTEALQILHKRQSMYNNAMAIEKRRRAAVRDE